MSDERQPEPSLSVPEAPYSKTCSVCGATCAYFSHEDWLTAPDLCLAHIPGLESLDERLRRPS